MSAEEVPLTKNSLAAGIAARLFFIVCQVVPRRPDRKRLAQKHFQINYLANGMDEWWRSIFKLPLASFL